MTTIDWLLWLGYFITLVAILAGWFWTIVLYIAGGRYLRDWQRRGPGREEDYLWVFLVPALNEGLTIADSVSRLRQVHATHKLMLVINDGSDDNTAEVLAGLAGPDLEVLHRRLPDAQKGKAAALNAAYHHVLGQLDRLPSLRGWSPERIIFAIVDADGRLDTAAPSTVARHFDDPSVGGVQISVRIYNELTWLTRSQGREFGVFGALFQVGRSRWGAAFMGGNGQFNRLAALASVAGQEGPWSHYLTEDQELGLRLLERGWRGEHEPFTYVAQQGVNSLRRLYRQRIRWMQGNLQVVLDLRRVHAHYLVGHRRFDATFTLLMPVFQVIVGTAIAVSVVLAVGFGVPYLPFDDPILLAFFLTMAFGPMTIAVLVQARGRGLRGLVAALAVTPSYIAYNWLMWPVVFIGLYKQLRGNTTWSKTAREAVDQGSQGAGARVASAPK